MKLIDIKGKSDYIRFIMEDGTFCKGSGELLNKGFCVYEATLKNYANELDVKPLTRNELLELKDEVAKLTTGMDFKVFFE